jgi:hypothetical protein
MNKRISWKALACVVLIAACALFAIVRTQAAANKLDAKLARKLISRVAGIELSKDAVKVQDKDISVLGGSSATVVAQIETAFRFAKDEKEIGASLKSGRETINGRTWICLSAPSTPKSKRARAELETLATALLSFKRERGFYPVTTSEAVLVDQLSPRYMKNIVRVDPWHAPYVYEGTPDNFTLRSTGADGKANTPDDITRNSSE